MRFKAGSYICQHDIRVETKGKIIVFQKGAIIKLFELLHLPHEVRIQFTHIDKSEVDTFKEDNI